MDAQYQHGSTDEAMAGVEDTMNTTPTGGYNNGYQPERRPSIQSQDYPPQNAPFSPNPNADPMPQNASQGYQQQPMQSYPRPSSGLSGSGDRYGHSQQYQEQPPRQAGNNATQSSVVIKVGMVGDAQIGKTSLMVKYVEGSWDEDYIQTLGMDSSEIYRENPRLTDQGSTSWKKPSQYGTPKSLSPSGILADNENSLICYL